MDLLRQVADCVLNGNCDNVAAAVRQALESGTSVDRIISEGLVAGMEVVGGRFRSGDMFIPEVLASAQAMHTGLDVLKPLVSQDNRTYRGVMVLGTVTGDIHDIGKNLVAMMMEGAGFRVVDLGVDVPTERFVAAVREHRPDILGMSALLTTTMTAMKDTIDALIQQGLRELVTVLVGGAPVSAGFARQIGADGYAPDGASAADLAKRLVEIRAQGG